MRKGQEPPAVRVLPADGAVPPDANPSEPLETEPHRSWSWLVPLGAAALALVLFLVATSPQDGESQAAPTTTPPRGADAGAIDVTDGAAAEMTTQWNEVPFEATGQIAGMITRNDSMIAYGSSDEVAQAWSSRTGAGWRPIPVIDVPANARSSIDHAVVWEDNLVALGSVADGTGLWVANSLIHWEYQGEIEAMGSLLGLAAGPELLAVEKGAARGAEMAGWKSTDGLEWNATDPLHGIADLGVALTLAADGTAYYLGGEAMCDAPRCDPSIYRSIDGVNWEQASLELPTALNERSGTVTDITASDDGLVAVGLLGPFPSIQTAVWSSIDGTEWTRLAEDEASLQPASVPVELASVSGGDTPSAIMFIAGLRQQVAAGAEVITDAGPFTVNEIDADSVSFTHDERTRRLAVGGRMTLERTALPVQVAVQGPRIVIAGEDLGEGSPTPIVWSSVDNAVTWERTVIPGDDQVTVGTALLGGYIAITGSGDSETPSFWHSTWDTSRAEQLGIDQLQLYVTALSEGDVEELAALLPADLRSTPRPAFQVPALADKKLSWWDQDKGTLRLDLVQETLDYLARIDATMTADGCSARLRITTKEELRVTCEISVTSDLTSILGASPEVGEIDAQYEDGSLQVVDVSLPASSRMWEMLATGTGSATPADRSTVVRSDTNGQVHFEPMFTAATADAHLRLATAAAEGLLLPGETTTVATPFGFMEWSWLEELPAPVYSFDWITHTDAGFIATASAGPDGPNTLSLWLSTDGRTWDEMATPDGVEWMWNFMPFQGGLVAEGWERNAPVLLLFDGVDWSKVTIPRDDGSDVNLSEMATTGDEVLVVTQSWGETGPLGHAGWVLGADKTLRKVELPVELSAFHNTLGLVGSEDGYVFAVEREGHSVQLWESENGDAWALMAEPVSLEDARYVWDLQHHGGRYFVVGEGPEITCTDASDDGSFCEPTLGVWSSPDGVVWDRVTTTTGDAISAYQIGSGPLGLAAVAQTPFSDPTSERLPPASIYLSSDAQNWEQAGDLRLFDPNAAWWWTNEPAVGRDTVMISGVANSNPVDSFDASDDPFIIVGRIIS